MSEVLHGSSPPAESAGPARPAKPAEPVEPTTEVLSGSLLSADDEVDVEEEAALSVSGTFLANRYRLDTCLASGAMGEVWRARDLQGDVAVAVKLIRSDRQDREFEDRFRREARVLSQIRHPNVLEVRDYGSEPRPYLVMELLEGEDLLSKIEREGRIPLVRAAEIFSQICAGLQHVHTMGILHRDIKPANVFCGRDGEVKLVDFGLAKRMHPLMRGVDDGSEGVTLERDLTKQDVLLGTVKYMSPEQMSRRTMDLRSDLWSAAVTLYRMLTGTSAYFGATEVDTMLNIMEGPTPVPSRDVKDLPPKLDNFFLRALQRNPAHRFASAAELSDALVRITVETMRTTATAGGGGAATRT